MNLTKLFTNEGNFVTEVFVFPNQNIDVIVWGDRAFIWRPEHEQYREGTIFIALS
jgi:hypothetical protein